MNIERLRKAPLFSKRDTTTEKDGDIYQLSEATVDQQIKAHKKAGNKVGMIGYIEVQEAGKKYEYQVQGINIE